MKNLYLFLFSFTLTLLYSGLYAQNFSEVAKLVASDRAASDQFGSSVSVSGNYAIVGAIFEDEDTSGGNTLSNAGSAYIFEKDSSGSWSKIQKIVASDRASGDGFGNSVAISGNFAIVGACNEDEDTSGGNTLPNAGSAYIFERDSSGDWIEVQKIVASDRDFDDLFGWAVFVSNNYVVIGAFQEDEDESGGNSLSNAGSAYIFERDSSGNWNQIQKIVASDRDVGDTFGRSVFISGNYIITGAPAEKEDASGLNTMAFAGSAYIFERDSLGYWNEVQKIVAFDRGISDNFGWAVSISGNYVIVSARGDANDVSGMNELLYAGSAYIFERDSSGTWNQVQKLVAYDRASYDAFGYSVSISGNYAIVGATGDGKNAMGGDMLTYAGSAYLFNRDSNGTWNQAQKILASDRSAYTEFGFSVSISSNYAIIGAHWDDEDVSGGNTMSGAGSAYVFCPYTSSSDTVIACGDYFWKGNKYTISGIYKDTIPNYLNCDSIITLNLTINSVDTSVNINTPMLISNQFNAGYQWIDCGNSNTPISGETNQSFTATNNGTYAVIITKNNCSDTSACYAISTIGIMENTFGAKLRIFPNPTAGNVSIELGENYDDVSIKVINITGQVVFEEQVMNSQFVNLNLTGSPGLYLLHINSSSSERAVIKVMKSE